MTEKLKASAWSRSGAILYPSDSGSNSDSSDDAEEPLPSLAPIYSASSFKVPVTPPIPAKKPVSTSITSYPSVFVTSAANVDLSTKHLDLSSREDNAVLKPNPFTQAKRRAIERIRRESLPPPEHSRAKRRGNIAVADPDPDRPRPADATQDDLTAPSKPAERYKRKFHDGWFTSTNQPIPNYRPSGRAAKPKAAKKAAGENGENDAPPKKRAKAGTGKKTAGTGTSVKAKKGKGKKSLEEEVISFGRIRKPDSAYFIALDSCVL